MQQGVFALYRFFAADDSLLYIGLTINPGARLKKHASEKPWWTTVARISIEQYASLETLRAAERAAIIAEKPLHNVVHNRGRSHVSATVPDEVCCGLRIGEVYALGLADGGCPVGLVEDGDDSGVIITPYDWLISMFVLEDEWICADEIKRWRKAERMSDEAKRSDGYNAKSTVFQMDALGAFQTNWKKDHELRLAVIERMEADRQEYGI